MFGFRFINKKELQRLRHIDEVFSTKISEKNEAIRNLKFKVEHLNQVNEKLVRKRDTKGRYIKT